MCSYCNSKPKVRGKIASYPYAAEGCMALAKLLLGEHGQPERRKTDSKEAIEHVQDFVDFEILDDNGQINVEQIRPEVRVMLNNYLMKTGRDTVRSSAELEPFAQELVDMLATCRESMESRVAMDAYQAKELARRFQALGELIRQLHD